MYLAVQGPGDQVFTTVVVPIYGCGGRPCSYVNESARVTGQQLRSAIERWFFVGADIREDFYRPVSLAHEQVFTVVLVPIFHPWEATHTAGRRAGQIGAVGLGVEVIRELRIGFGSHIKVHTDLRVPKAPSLADNKVIQLVVIPVHEGRYGIPGHLDINTVGLNELFMPKIERRVICKSGG